MGKIHVAPREVEGGIYLSEIHKLRDNTKIGETIRFKSNRYYEESLSGYIGKPKIIKAKVTAKYPHVFALDNGEVHTWKDYALGMQV